MKSLLLLAFLASMQLYAQKKDTLLSAKQATAASVKPEILTSGFIDVVNNGQVNASARFIRLQLGEPGKFSLPLSFYSGVSNNNFQTQTNNNGIRNNDHLVNQYINPLSGLINVSAEDLLWFSKNKKGLTRTGLLYQLGLRVLTGYSAGAGNGFAVKPVNFPNSFGVAGFCFQTGAWEKSNAKNVGVTWLAVRYIACKSGPAQLKKFMPGINTNGFYHGWSVGWGVEINNLVNMKLIYYKYVTKPEIEYSQPLYQFSFHYSLR